MLSFGGVGAPPRVSCVTKVRLGPSRLRRPPLPAAAVTPAKPPSDASALDTPAQEIGLDDGGADHSPPGVVVTSGPLTPPPDSEGTVVDDRAFHHSVAEDVQGMVLATLTASLGLAVFAKGGLMIGGMAGVAFLTHYAFGWNFGLMFVLVNLPFYWLSVRRMGWEFTLKTFCLLYTSPSPRDRG